MLGGKTFFGDRIMEMAAASMKSRDFRADDPANFRFEIRKARV